MKFKKVGIAALALSLSITQLPVNAFADTMTTEEKVESRLKEKAKDLKNQKKYAEGEAIVLFSDTYTKKASKNALKATGLSNKYTVKELWNFSNKDGKVNKTGSSGIKFGDYVVAVVKSKTLSTKELINKLEKMDNVKKAEPNYVVHATDIPDYYDYQWALDNKGQNGGTADLDINADSLWAENVKGTEKVIAIIDTGFDYNNEDLKNVAWTNPKQGKLGGVHGYDFVNGDGDPMDDNGHGTHCSGIMAAATEEARVGISGVNQSAKIMGLKFLDEGGSGYLEDAIAAYNYIYQAQSLGIDVVAVNNSWGEVESSIFNDICIKVGEKGAVSCFAAGNDGSDNDTHDNIIGSEENPYIITVAATNEKDELADFSEYGKKTVTLAAPGADILSTVSYDCFNPSIYSDELNNALCGNNYNKYDNTTIGEYTKLTEENKTTGVLGADSQIGAFSGAQTEFGVPTYMIACDSNGKVNESATTTVSVDDSNYMGKEAGKSLKLSANAKEGDYVTFAIPITGEASEIEKTFSSMLKFSGPKATKTEEFLGMEFPITSSATFDFVSESTAKQLAKDNFVNFEPNYGTDINGTNNYWTHLSETMNNKDAGTTYLIFQFWCNYDGEYSAWIEDIALTKGVKNENAQFGRYDYYNGTSMATPYVTGSVALLSSLYPEATAEDLVAIASGSVRKAASLEGKTVTGGVLDLKYAKDPAPFITSMSVSQDASVTINGVGFKAGTTVKVNGNDTTNFTIDEKGKTLVVNCSEHANKQVEIEVTTDRGSVKKNCFVATGKEYYHATKENPDAWEAYVSDKSQTVTDGTDMYIVDPLPDVTYVYKVTTTGSQEGGYTTDSSFVTALNFDTIFERVEAGSSSIMMNNIAEGIVLRGNNMYMLVSAMDNDTKYTQTKLIKADLETGEIEVVSEIPAAYDNVSIGTLVSYNGKLMIVGGYDYGTKSFSTMVQEYSFETNEWTQGVALPEGRDGGKCIQVGDKLVYTMGNAVKDAENKYTCPKNLIFDGKEWKVSAAAPVDLLTYKDDKLSNGFEFRNYTSNIGVCKEGVLYSGVSAIGLGDTFIYDVASDSYSTAGYQFSISLADNQLRGTVVNDMFVGVTTYHAAGMEEDDEGMWGLSNNGSHNLSKESEYDSCGEVFAVPVNSGLINVTAAKNKNGQVVLSTEHAMPGAWVTATAVANKGYLPSYISVDGQKIKGDTAEFIVNKPITVKAGFVAAVTKIKLNKTNVKLKAGKKFVIKATVLPKKAANKAVTFKSSNTKYATVSASGVVTAKKAGIGKTVTITITAKDGSKVKAKCKIKIVK